MIKIGNNKYRDIEQLNEEHWRNVRPGVLTRLHNSFRSGTISLCQRDFIRDNLDVILKGTPGELVQVSHDYKDYCNARRCSRITKGLTKILGYHSFKKKHPTHYCAYTLAAALDVRVCPYCNRQYTNTIVTWDDHISRPEFDHFFSQVDFPLLAMSFYNLIPSCKICNSTLKHRKKFTLEKYIHPYLNGFDPDVRFNYLPKDAASAAGLSGNLEILLEVSEDCLLEKQLNNNIRVFKLKEIYQAHADVVTEIVRKFYMSDGRYLETLYNSFPMIGTYEELYRLAFGNYVHLEHHDQRILAKLTKDIVSYLDFVLPIAIDG